jgi:hypothetical protein
MSAPKRWLDDGGGATRGERDLLRLGAAHEAPATAKDAVWTALLAQIPPVPPGSSGGGNGAPGAGGAKLATGAKAAAAAGASGSGSAAVAGAVGGGLIKSALIGAGSALALIATYTVVTPAQAPSVPAPVTIETAAAPDPGARSAAPGSRGQVGQLAGSSPIARETPGIVGSAAAPDSMAPLGAPAAVVSADPRAGGASPAGSHDSKGATGSSSSAASAPVDRETRLLEESRRLAEARDALRRGDASGALSLLSDLQRAVPGGILGQEREALAIEALAKSGRSAEAQTRARAFLQAYPQSPHAARVEAFAR